MERLQVFNYSVQNSSSDSLEVHIDGQILDAETQEIFREWFGDETSVSFKSVRDQVNNSGAKNITFYVNSPGGHVGDAMAIHDWIKDLSSKGYNVTTKGLGMICSAATYILSAGGENSHISRNSWYMIHNVSGGICGDVNMIENYAKMMRKFNDTIVNFYADLTGKTAEEVNAWMDAETWFTGPEAVEHGFVKNLLGEQPFTNLLNADHFPYKNKSALNLYNSFVKPEPLTNEDENFNLTTDMNKLIEGIINGLKSAGFIPANATDAGKPLTEDGLTNALTNALKDFNISDMVNQSVNEMFKDGLPEAMTNALNSAFTAAMDEKLKNYATTEQMQEVEKAVANNAGGAKPKNKGGEPENDYKYEHEGISFGKKDDE